MTSEPIDLDSQMAEAARSQAEHVRASHTINRAGWTRQQWIDDAEEQFNNLHGSVLDLLNGHVSALLAEVHRLREQQQRHDEAWLSVQRRAETAQAERSQWETQARDLDRAAARERKRAEQAEAKLARVRELHTLDRDEEGTVFCVEDVGVWPCNTRRALDEEQECWCDDADDAPDCPVHGAVRAFNEAAQRAEEAASDE